MLLKSYEIMGKAKVSNCNCFFSYIYIYDIQISIHTHTYLYRFIVFDRICYGLRRVIHQCK